MSDNPLSPEARANPGAAGTEVEIAGEPWLLAASMPWLGPVWGRLYDQNVIAGRYEPEDVGSAAMQLLYVNYRLSPDEAARLIVEAPLAELVKAVEAALFPEERQIRWHEWAESALIANGIDPAKVPGRLLHVVLHQLVETKRAVPPHAVVDSLQAASQRAAFGA